MVAVEPPQQCYLTEWWEPMLLDRGVAEMIATLKAAAAQLSTGGHAIRLQVAVSAPSDQVLYSVFAADCLETVTRTCRRAGWPADRISGDVELFMPRPVPD